MTLFRLVLLIESKTKSNSEKSLPKQSHSVHTTIVICAEPWFWR